jgi:hypothetical protein
MFYKFNKFKFINLFDIKFTYNFFYSNYNFFYFKIGILKIKNKFLVLFCILLLKLKYF